MPCIPGSSKHKPCAKANCSNEEGCPCIIQPAFSCKPSTNDHKKESCCPKVAYGIVNTTDLEVINFIGNGIAGVTGGEAFGFTGLFNVQFENNFFDSCDPTNIPVINAQPAFSLDSGGMLGIRVVNIIIDPEQPETLFNNVVIITTLGDERSNNVPFIINATQYPKNCK